MAYFEGEIQQLFQEIIAMALATDSQMDGGELY